MTGFDVDALNSSPLVAFVANLDWHAFLKASHADDVELIRRLSRSAERVFDVVRFELCRLDLPQTLPGVVGSWDQSGPYLGAMLSSSLGHESYLIAGEAVESTIVARGIGLELKDVLTPVPSVAEGEVAAIAIHALALLSDAMVAGTETIKFSRLMTLPEFLASGGEYKNWKRLKGDILCHCAGSKRNYHQLAERFRELTSIEDRASTQVGIRTRIIHHGEFLEDIASDVDERKAIFRELHGYGHCVIEDMLKHRTLSWMEYVDRRAMLKTALGV